MKELKLEITVLVPDDYEHCDDPGWIMDEMIDPSSNIYWKSTTIIES